MKFVPRKWQEPAIEFLYTLLRGALWLPMGSGKTGSTLQALVTLQDFVEDVMPVLIVAPLRVAKNTWPDEIAQWDFSKHLKVATICGTAKQRLAALRPGFDVYTINFENLPWLLEVLGEKWPFKTVVVDESSKLKGFRTRMGSSRAKALAKRAFRSKRFWMLTGTPASNGLQDLWGQSWFIDKGQRLGPSFSAFTERFFISEQVTDNQFATKLTPTPTAQKTIEGLLKDVTLAIKLEDYLDLKLPVVNKIHYELPDKARKAYKDMADSYFTELFDDKGQLNPVEAVNAGARSQKLLQCAGGFMYGEDKTVLRLHDEIISSLESIVEEWAGENIMVSYQYPPTRDAILKAFKGSRYLDKDPQTMKDWNAGKIPMLLAHPQSAGHGLSLQHGGRILVFAETAWNLEEHLQIIERIGPTRQMQSGYDRLVYLYYLLGDKTIHNQVFGRLVEKKTMQQCLVDAMNEHSKSR